MLFFSFDYSSIARVGHYTTTTAFVLSSTVYFYFTANTDLYSWTTLRLKCIKSVTFLRLMHSHFR